MRKTKHEGVFQRGRKIYSKSLTPGKQVYGEKLIGDYRELSVRRSKLGAAIIKGLKNTRIKSGDKVLYLGASSGTTPSHISDIVGKKGAVFCIDIAYRMVRDLVFLCEERENMYPLLENANFPERYSTIFPKVDVVYQDVAVRNQVQILNRNTDLFLKRNGYALVAIKARSIDISKKPNEVFKQVESKLKKSYTILEKINLSPYEKDHMFFVLKKA
jgi:fibrillarin-like pre-rRNA processing protein